jgi:hypothetical protein
VMRCPIGVKSRNTLAEHMFSASPPTTDVAQHRRHVGKVPNCDIEGCEARTEKSRPEASIQTRANQAALNTGFDFRRYAMKPRPAKPRSSIAQVESSGTPSTAVRPAKNGWPLRWPKVFKSTG